MSEELNTLQFERLVNSIERMIEARKSFRRDLAIEQANGFTLKQYCEWFVTYPDGAPFIVDASRGTSCEICFKWAPERCVTCDMPVCQDCQDIHICEGE